MAKGGARKGSGRKPGVSKATLIKRSFQEYFTEDEGRELIADLKIAMKKDSKLKVLAIEQLFGKAPQRLEMTGKDGDKLIIELSQTVAHKNGIKNP